MGEIAPIAFLIVGMVVLIGFSRMLFRSNRTREVRSRPVELRRSKAAQPEPQLIWRTLVAAPAATSRRGRH